MIVRPQAPRAQAIVRLRPADLLVTYSRSSWANNAGRPAAERAFWLSAAVRGTDRDHAAAALPVSLAIASSRSERSNGLDT